MESKLALIQQLPPSAPPSPMPSPLLLEVQQLRQEIEALRTALQQTQENQPAFAQLQLEIVELKSTMGTLANLIRLSAGPRLPEIREAVRGELTDVKKTLLVEMQSEAKKIVHAELEAALKLLKKHLDALPEKIVQALPPQKKGLFG